MGLRHYKFLPLGPLSALNVLPLKVQRKKIQNLATVVVQHHCGSSDDQLMLKIVLEEN
jgi:hypothetical protein